MKLKIDIDKSIDKEKICPKSKFSYYADYLWYGFFALVFLFYIIMDMRNDNSYELTEIRILLISVYVIVFSFIFYSVDKMKKLTVLSIKDRTKAKQFIHSLATTEIDWVIRKEEAEIIIFHIDPKSSSERQVTFIFRNGDLYINVMTFTRDIISPIYYSSDKDFQKTIIEKLKENRITQFDIS